MHGLVVKSDIRDLDSRSERFPASVEREFDRKVIYNEIGFYRPESKISISKPIRGLPLVFSNFARKFVEELGIT